MNYVDYLSVKSWLSLISKGIENFNISLGKTTRKLYV